ncbi:MAG: relaxase/mobilization nuclease RlxS [Amphiplicatus sp.]
MVQSGARHMTTPEDEFQPRLGRIRSRGGKPAKRYLGKLYAAMEKARPGAFAARAGTRFTGERVGRGAGMGAAFAFREHPFAKFRARRVAVKIRSVRMGANGLAKARAHLNYIQRDGTDRNGAPAKLYGPEREAVDGNAFLEDGKDDRHQFRIILSPEDAGELDDLTSFTRDVMAAAEKDLGTKLDWVAVNHFNTDHPHAHIVLRGRDERGADLVIARNYVTHGFRRRAEELATLELGPRGDLEIARSRFLEVAMDRFTQIDRDLIGAAQDGAIEIGRPRTPFDRFQTKLLLARLRHLEKVGLASREHGRWRLSDGMEDSLREIGRRRDIIRSMGAALGERFAPARLRDLSEAADGHVIVGRVAGYGALDDSHDRRFLALEGADGNQWRAPFDFTPGAAPPVGAVVEASRARAEPKPSDVAIAAIAARNGGVYSAALHRAAEPGASAAFIEAHKRRLEALRRDGMVTREWDGSWRIPDDFLDRAIRRDAERMPSRVRVLSWVSLDRQVDAKSVSLLDDMLEQRLAVDAVDHGFGAELERAATARRRWLLAEGLARETADGFAIDREKLQRLTHRELSAAGEKLAKEFGKKFSPAMEGERVEGVYRRPVDLPAGRFALIEKAKDFTLLPWREALEKRRAMEVSGVLRLGGVDWTFGRSRGGPAR